MDLRIVTTIARHEARIHLRNRWMLLVAAVFAVLVLALAVVGTSAEGFDGVQSFRRTSISILNLILAFVPLVALTMGTLTFTNDRGGSELLFAQPVDRGDVMLGKMWGVVVALSASMMAGFVGAGLVIVGSNGTDGLVPYLTLVGLSLLLGAIFVFLAGLTAIAQQRRARAFGTVLFLWFFFVLFYDLAAIGITTGLRGPSAMTFIFVSLFGNPIDLVRVGTLLLLDNAAVFGPAGTALVRFLGGSAASAAVLLLALGAWIVLPVTLAHRLLSRQDL